MFYNEARVPGPRSHGGQVASPSLLATVSMLSASGDPRGQAGEELGPNTPHCWKTTQKACPVEEGTNDSSWCLICMLS